MATFMRLGVILMTTEHTMKTVTEVSTKRDEDGQAVNTMLTVNWPEAQNAVVIAMALGWIKVKLQTGWRKNGIPAKLEVNALDHAPGSRIAAKPTVEGEVARASTMTPEERAAIIAQLKKMDEKA